METDRDRWREQAAAVEADRDRWREQAAAAKAREAGWESWLKRHRELEERLRSIERATAYRLYRAFTALARRFWTIKP